jgi:heptosyltransferase-2
MGKKSLESILIIQTAFLGDVILATSLVEKIYDHFPDSKIDFLLRKGYESLFDGHPKINEVIVFDKKKQKFFNLYRLIVNLRKKKYDLAVNVQRFSTTGLITVLSKSTIRVGFDKNPFSYFFDNKIKHAFDGSHEIERNHKLIEWFTDDRPLKPRLYPAKANFENVKQYSSKPYICVAPASVWYTKQFPEERWLEFIGKIHRGSPVYLLGSFTDYDLCERIRNKLEKNVINLCGKINLLDSAALMKNATRNLVNDSAPMHIASSMNAPVAVFYCSTLPSFGYGPLSDDARVIQVDETLECRPCGKHGLKSCPQGHFDCAGKIDLQKIIEDVNKRLDEKI